MTETEQIRTSIGAAFEAYHRVVQSVANKVFEEQVIPFCLSRGWWFVVGQGNWWIGPPPTEDRDRFIHEAHIGSWCIPDDVEFVRLAKILETDIPGMTSVDLGCLMRDYTPEASCCRVQRPRGKR